MKTSLKIIIGMLTVLFLAMIGAGWSFRQQYDRLDHTDPYAQYSRKALPGFRVVKLTGNWGENCLVQPGPSPVLRIRPNGPTVTYRTVSDTLLVNYAAVNLEPDEYYKLPPGESSERFHPRLIVSAPAIQTIIIDQVTCKIPAWHAAILTLRQTGTMGNFILAGATIDHLTATVSGNGVLSTEAKNTIGQATIKVNGTASFFAKKTTFTSLDLQADSAATVILPGALLAKIR